MTRKFVIISQNLIKTYHRKSGKSKCDRKVTELNFEITRILSRVNGVLTAQYARSAVELTTNFDTGESNRDLTAGLKMASHKTTG